jgi:hypothetical protein
VDGTDSGSCAAKGLGIRCIEPTLSATIVLVIECQYIICINSMYVCMYV